jgi:hypothetical protein
MVSLSLGGARERIGNYSGYVLSDCRWHVRKALEKLAQGAVNNKRKNPRARK